LALAGWALVAAQIAVAQTGQWPAASPPGAAERNLTEWLVRMHDASRNRAYTGTFVVSMGTAMASARIWHVCDGRQQVERVEALTGPARSTLRRNDEVITFLPDSRTAIVERRESLGLFPALLQTPSNTLADHYILRQTAVIDRVAGFDADVLELMPRDDLRFGYRIWSERKSGLVVKLQTLDADQRVLEQVAFSELQLDAPVRMDQLLKRMKNTQGYTVQQASLTRTTPEAQGWRLRRPVPGFTPVACHVRAEASAGARGPSPMQWVFSDGLASMSLFVEPFDPARHTAEMAMSTGATHSLTRRHDDFWLTVVGETPPAALKMLAAQLERLR
jgi:sigma-E factor negative regulatory protein RseB